jgi:DNA polymerase-3 subunit alpha
VGFENSFVHLHVHSSYSLAEGAIKAEKIPQLAKDLNMPAVAMTDTGNMFGALEFALSCQSKGVQPIMGCQLWLADSNHGGRYESQIIQPKPIVALAANQAGLSNLQKLSSLGYMGSDPSGKPAVQLNNLLQHADGLFLLTGGTTGPLATLLANGQVDAAYRLRDQLFEAFGDRLVIELNRHGWAIENKIEPALLELADSVGLPIVATNDVYFAKPAMYEAHDALLCITDGRLISDQDRRRVTPEHWFKPAQAMREIFADLPDACSNTVAIAQRCAVMSEVKPPELPTSPKVQAGMSETETVQDMARKGLEVRMDQIGANEEKRSEYHKRLEYELDIIATMGFSGYFLIVADFIQWAKAHDIPVGPGRGSGAGSVAAWALTITDLDPMRWGLLFERFLNPERVSMPDFDIDFCQDKRDQVINYVRNEYGADRVAQIITYGKLQAKAVIRDVGRVMGVPYGQVNRIAELIPNNPAHPVTLQQAIDGETRLQDMRNSDETIGKLFDIALQLEGLYRNASTHAAGVVIGRKPLIEILPVYRDSRSDMLVTQYSMKYVEQASLVKFDFLGLKTLTVLKKAVDILKGRGIQVDLEKIPLDDRQTYDMLARGDAAGVFQFEGQGMRDCLKQMRVDRFEDLIAAVALYRPGPMANIPEYCARKKGAPWAPLHPKIKHIVEETFGIMVYQEQVMQIGQDLAGYSLGGADLLRRAMGKKIRSEMEKQRVIFCDGAEKNGVTREKAGEIFDVMEKFADYGFNKSHAAAYALVSYQTAWMKANYPVAFIAALMSLDLDKTEKLANHIQEARRLGIPVLPADINKSGPDFWLEDQPDGVIGIRYALGAVKRVGEASMKKLAEARDQVGPFKSLSDFSARVDAKVLNKMQVENLAKAGAFDCLEPNRAKVCAGAEVILKRAQVTGLERASGQAGLFGNMIESAKAADVIRLPNIEDWSHGERLAYERDALGFHISSHPLDRHSETLKSLGITPSSHISLRVSPGANLKLKLAGTVINIKERTTRTGSKMAWVKLSDPSGVFEVTCFSEVLKKSRDLLSEGKTVVFAAEAKSEGENIRITANECSEFTQAVSDAGEKFRISIDSVKVVDALRDILRSGGRGKSRISILPRAVSVLVNEVAIPGGFNVTPLIIQTIRGIPGVVAVEEILPASPVSGDDISDIDHEDPEPIDGDPEFDSVPEAA